MYFITLLALLLCTNLDCYPADSTYIADNDHKYTVKGFVSNDFLSVTRSYSEKEFTYKSNKPVGVGAGFYLPGFGMSFSYGVEPMVDRSKGKTKAFDIQYSYYGKRFVADIIVQSHTGFYLEKENPADVYRIYPDMKAGKYGISGTYIFNYDKFSYRAVFNNSERQIRSAGSMIAGAGANIVDIRGLGEISGIPEYPHSIRVFLGGPFIGYTHTWVLREYFYINFGGTVGTDLAIGDMEWGLYPSIVPRLSFGYDNDGIAIYFNYKNHIAYPLIRGNQRIGVSSGTMNLGIAIRFSRT